MTGINIANDNCMHIMESMGANSMDLIICDLNYGNLNKQNPDAITSNVCFDDKQLKKFCRLVKKIVKPTGTIIFFGKEMFSVNIINILKDTYKYRYVWKKGNVTGFLSASKAPLCVHEDILIFQKEETRKNYEKKPHTYNPQKTKGEKRYASMTNIGKEKHSNTYGKHKESLQQEDTCMRYPTTLLEYSMSKSEYIIPTQKPVDLMIYLVETYTNKGDVVFDPCMGSGSSGIASIMTGREFIGIEIDKERFDTASKRIKETPIIKRVNL